MYTPKKLKWNSLTEFRDFLQRETTEKIVIFNGYQLITETTEYGIIDGLLRVSPKQKKVVDTKIMTLGDRPKLTKKKKEIKVKEKSKKEILAEMRERGKKALENRKKK